MNDISNARIAEYQFEILFTQSTSEVWSLMVDRINQWWSDDFRALASGSIVVFNAKCGGYLIESDDKGASLEWYRVQMVEPGKSVYLVGYLAPDWGGPTTSMLKLALENRSTGCALVVSDALLGNVTEASASSAERGWKQLFENGLKRFADAQ